MGLKKRFIVVEGEQFRMSEVQSTIDTIAEHFSVYLDGFFSKNKSDNKHSIMGPVGKVLEKIKTDNWGQSDLLGYTLRVHEMTNNSGSYLPPASLNGLEQGIEGLLALLEETPLGYKSRVIERVGHAVYFKRRKKDLEYFENVRQDFIEFLKERYCSCEELAKAWGEEGLTFDNVKYPSNAEEEKASGQKERDIKEFKNLN